MARGFHNAYVTAKIHKKIGILIDNTFEREETMIEEEFHRFIDAAYATISEGKDCERSEICQVYNLEQALVSTLMKLEKSDGHEKITLERLLMDYLHKLDEKNTTESNKRNHAFIRIVCHVSGNPYLTDHLKTTLRSFANYLGAIHQEKVHAIGPSMAAREACRTPSAVLIDFIRSVRIELEKHDNHPLLTSLKNNSEALYLKRKLSITSVKTFIKESRSALQDAHELTRLEITCGKLLGQLPKSSDDLHLTQLHDCIYGRVFDTAFVERLVTTPPAGVGRAMTVVGHYIADWLTKQDPKLQRKVTDQMIHYINVNDPRFWFPKTPLIQKMQFASNWKEAYSILIEYLRKEKTTGYEIISVPYLVVKISLALDHNKEVVFEPIMPEILEPLPNWSKIELNNWKRANKQCKAKNDDRLWTPIPWMSSVNGNYVRMISLQRSVENPPPGNKNKAKASGITLMHQPAVAPHDWMIASERPSNKNRPHLKKPSQSLETALKHGLPWGVGVSNSTSIMLHIFHHAVNNGSDIDFEKLLLGTMMFLVYDGGHSVYEVLWTANQINGMLELGLDLSDCSDPRSFIADYQRFSKMFSMDVDISVKDALSKAMDGVIAYFNKYSYTVKL